jgi:hypothetical protein
MQPTLVRVLDSAGPLTVVSSIKQCCQAPRASPGWSHKQFLRKIWQPFQQKLDSQAGRSSVITSTIYNSIDYYLEKIRHGYYLLQHYKERWLDGKEVEKSSSTFGLLLAYFVLSTPWLTPEKRFYEKNIGNSKNKSMMLMTQLDCLNVWWKIILLQYRTFLPLVSWTAWKI